MSSIGRARENRLLTQDPSQKCLSNYFIIMQTRERLFGQYGKICKTSMNPLFYSRNPFVCVKALPMFHACGGVGPDILAAGAVARAQFEIHTFSSWQKKRTLLFQAFLASHDFFSRREVIFRHHVILEWVNGPNVISHLFGVWVFA